MIIYERTIDSSITCLILFKHNLLKHGLECECFLIEQDYLP